MKISKLFTYFLIATVGFGSTALAEGTEAGTKITNAPTLEYRMDGVLKESKVPEASYLVDKVLNYTVDLQESKERDFVIGKSTLSQFLLTNRGNSVEDFVLKESYGALKSFQFTKIKIYVDKNKNGILDDSEKVHTSVLEKLSIGAKRVIWIEAETTMMDRFLGKKTNFGLMVRASSSGRDGVYINQSIENSMSKMDVIFADGSGDDDSARNNMAINRYIWKAKKDVKNNRLKILLFKNDVWSDPVNGKDNPKAIPGAVVRKIWKIENNTDEVARDVLFTATANLSIEVIIENKAGTHIENSSRYSYPQYANDSKYKNIIYGKIDGNRINYNIPKIPAGEFYNVVFYTKIK